MKIELTETQLERLIELARKARTSKTDGYLIDYLKQYLMPGKVTPINYDEIPF